MKLTSVSRRRISLLFLFLVLNAPVAFSQDTTRLSMVFLGDIMQHDSQITDAWDPDRGVYDYAPCFQYIKPYLQAADLAVGNLEVTLAGKPYKGYPQFSAPDELLVALKDIGMDVIVTANNHSVDRGKAGLERTIALLDSFGIAHTGTFRNPAEKERDYPLIVEKEGFRIAFLNYTYGTNGLPVRSPNIVNRLDTAAIRQDLIRARDLNPDAIVVLPHWGLEYQSLPSMNQREIAEWCFRHGATLVIGSHPHVVQPMEWHRDKNRFVAWSLGNFVSGQRKRYTDGGALVRIELQKVTFNDGSSRTDIDTAGYVLEWVYRTRDAEQNYYVYPVAEVDERPLQYKMDATSREAFQTFVNDSRALFRKHNKDVSEFLTPVSWYVEFHAVDTVAISRYLKEHSGMSGYEVDDASMIYVGPMTEPDARHLYERIRRNLPVEFLAVRRKQ